MSCLEGSAECYAPIFGAPAAEQDGCGLRRAKNEDITLGNYARGISGISQTEFRHKRWRAPPCMRWRGPARSCYANYRLLGVCRCSTDHRGRKPAGIPGFPVLPALPESPPAGPRFRRQEISTASASPAQEVCADNLKKLLIHTPIHIFSAVIPRREGFSTGPSTVLSTASRRSRNCEAIVRPPLPAARAPGPACRTSAVPGLPDGSIEPRGRPSATIRARLKPLPCCGPASQWLHGDGTS
jgi:hypothetical protein